MQTFVHKEIMDYSLPWTKMNGQMPTDSGITNGVAANYGPRSFYAENFVFPRTPITSGQDGPSGSIDGLLVKIGYSEKIGHLGVQDIQSNGYYLITYGSGSSGVRIQHDPTDGGQIKLWGIVAANLTPLIQISAVANSYFMNNVVFGAYNASAMTPVAGFGNIWPGLYARWSTFKYYFFGGTYVDYLYADYQRINNLDVSGTIYFRTTAGDQNTYKTLQSFYSSYVGTKLIVDQFVAVGGNLLSVNIMANLAAMDNPNQTFTNNTWGYLRAIDQPLAQSNSPTFASLYVGAYQLTSSMVQYLTGIVQGISWPNVATVNQSLSTFSSPTFVSLGIGPLSGTIYFYNGDDFLHLRNMNYTSLGVLDKLTASHDNWKQVQYLDQALGTGNGVVHDTIRATSTLPAAISSVSGGIFAAKAAQAAYFKSKVTFASTANYQIANNPMPGIVCVYYNSPVTLMLPNVTDFDVGYTVSITNATYGGAYNVVIQPHDNGTNKGIIIWNGVYGAYGTLANNMGATLVFLGMEASGGFSLWACVAHSKS